MRAVGRIFAVLLGFIAACVAAAAFFMAAKVGLEPQSPETSGWFWGQFFVFGGLTAAILGSMAFVPFVVVALVTEALAIRSLVVHAGVWGLLGLVAAHLFDGIQAGDTTLRADRMVMLATGFVAGLVYWALAGRTAGVADPPPADGAADRPT